MSKKPAVEIFSLKRLLEYVTSQGWDAEALTSSQLVQAINADSTTTVSVQESSPRYKMRCKDCGKAVIFNQVGYPIPHTKPNTNKACRMKRYKSLTSFW